MDVKPIQPFPTAVNFVASRSRWTNTLSISLAAAPIIPVIAATTSSDAKSIP